MSGTIKLSQDMATLVNNRQGSDVQFKVGGAVVQENGEAIHDESATVTLYAHSCILRCRSRYFATMLDEEKNWKENSKGVIYKPNISASTFQVVLHYIYTGNVPAKTSENIAELIAIANEMDLEELIIGCQNELIHTVKYIFSDADDSNDENKSIRESIRESFEESTKEPIPVDVALRTHIIPALNLANRHSLSRLSQELLTIMLPNMSVIIKSPSAYTTFINNISSEALTEIIASDNLAVTEHEVWDLALSWACHQTNLSKAAIEARLTNLDNVETNSDGAMIGHIHLNQVKVTLAPLLPVIRFSFLDLDDFAQMASTLNYFLPRHRFFEINRHFLGTNCTKQLDSPRTGKQASSKIVTRFTTWEWLRKNIFETSGITNCSSPNDLKFEPLFRASEHGFFASTFHQRCDGKGPTLTLVKSADGHLFGGVNFIHWSSKDAPASSPLNFLFALPDGYHRKNTLIFKIIDQSHIKYSSYNVPSKGPAFGYGYDLVICDSANANEDSYSNMPTSYHGSGVSNVALAGTKCFRVSDYEVFTISKK